MFISFAVYMAEITVANDKYKLYEGFLVLGSVEFIMAITLTVDIYLCPFAVFFSHTYAFLRIYLAYDNVSDVLCPGMYFPLFHFTMSCHLFNIHSKKDFLLTEMQKEMIKRFLIILKTFPERIIISQKNAHGEVDYAFTNDEMTEDALIKGDGDTINESILRKDEDVDIFAEETIQADLENSFPLDIFLEEERNKTMEDVGFISESKIVSMAPFHTTPGESYNEVNANIGREEIKDDAALSKKHYTVKTRQIKWGQDINIDGSVNKTLSFLHIFIDNTSSEKLKQEKTLREYQRMMLSSVAHEFRNPLNAIQGNLQLIEMNQDPKIERFVKISKNSCTLLNSYVEDILDLGRIEGSAFQLNCDEFKVGDVIKEVEDIFEIELRHKKIKFEVNITQRFKLVKVYTDRDRLRQVIINLISNAIKFCNSMIKVD